MIEDLLKLGFSQHEANIYLALIDIGQTGAGQLVRQTGLHRNIVYETLDRLIAKKLVLKVFKKNIAQFVATDPKRILENQKANLSLAESLVPELLGRADTTSNIVIWDGLEGFRNFSVSYMERLKKNGVFYCIGSTGDLWYERMGDASRRYFKLKAQKKIHWKMIYFGDPSVSTIDIKTMKKNKLDEVRILPKNQESPANIIIWEDNVALQIFAEPMSVVEIRSKALAQSYYLYFQTIWEMGKSIIGL